MLLHRMVVNTTLGAEVLGSVPVAGLALHLLRFSLDILRQERAQSSPSEKGWGGRAPFPPRTERSGSRLCPPLSKRFPNETLAKSGDHPELRTSLSS